MAWHCHAPPISFSRPGPFNNAGDITDRTRVSVIAVKATTKWMLAALDTSAVIYLAARLQYPDLGNYLAKLCNCWRLNLFSGCAKHHMQLTNSGLQTNACIAKTVTPHGLLALQTICFPVLAIGYHKIHISIPKAAIVVCRYATVMPTNLVSCNKL